MNELSSINTNLYKCYAITNAKSNIKIYLHKPDGDVLYEDYDLFSVGEKTLIAFKKLDKTNSDYAYKIVSDELTDWIQSTTFWQLSFIINSLYDITKTVFYITDSISVPDAIATKQNLSIHGEGRCDATQYGPGPFSDESNFGGPSIDPQYHNVSNIKNFLMTLNSLSNLHILYFEYKELSDSAYRNFFGGVGAAKTLMGIMKIIIEWAETCEFPWSNDQIIARKCKQALIDLAVPNDVIEEIKQVQSDMVVARYLSNDPECRGDVEEQINLSPLFKKWLCSKIRYESINLLQQNNIDTISIPNEILEIEKQQVYFYLYKYLINQNINLQDYTLEQIEQKIANKEIVTVDFEGQNIFDYINIAKGF